MTAAAMLHNKVLELTASYFDIRQRWTPSLKTRMSVIAEDEPELHARLMAFYSARFDEQRRSRRRWARCLRTLSGWRKTFKTRSERRRRDCCSRLSDRARALILNVHN